MMGGERSHTVKLAPPTSPCSLEELVKELPLSLRSLQEEADQQVRA